MTFTRTFLGVRRRGLVISQDFFPPPGIEPERAPFQAPS
jgi:hypothetical protein